MRQKKEENDVSFLKDLNRKNPKLSPIVSTLVCVGIGLERAKSYAEAQQAKSPVATEVKAETEVSKPTQGASIQEKIDLPLPTPPSTAGAPTKATKSNEKTLKKNAVLQMVPLEYRAVQKYESVKTKQEACNLLEGKVVTYYDAASIVVGCTQRPIEDADLLNELVYKQKKQVAEVPAHVYRLIPFGEPWAAQQNQSLTSSRICRELNGKYVTSTGTDYFLIEACRKRPFSSYVELQSHNKRNAPVLSVSPEQLDKLDEGKPVAGSYDKEVEALYKIVGDSALSPLGSADGRSKPVRSAEELNALPVDASKEKVDGKRLCQQFNNKVISFYSQLYFISNCQRRHIRELPIVIQQRFAERGTTIVDLTPAQLDSIPLGAELSEDEAVSLIK